MHVSVAYFGSLSFRAERNFVEAIHAVNDEGAHYSELGERPGFELDNGGRKHADDLEGSSRGIRERAEEIENGATTEVTARGHHMLHRGVRRRGEQKAEADFTDCG